MKKLTATQEKVLETIRKSVAQFQSYKDESTYIAMQLEDKKNYLDGKSEERVRKFIESAKGTWNTVVKELVENNACLVWTSVKPATLKALEDAGYIRRLHESRKDMMDVVQLLK